MPEITVPINNRPNRGWRIRGNTATLLTAFLITLMAACGPSATYQEGEGQVDNVTAPQQEDPTATPEATAGPIPTICIDVPNPDSPDDGPTSVCMAREPTSTPLPYGHMDHELNEKVAEEQSKAARRSTNNERALRRNADDFVYLQVAMATEADLDAVRTWLKGEKVAIESSGPANEFAVEREWDDTLFYQLTVHLPPDLLPALALREDITGARMVVIAFEIYD